MKSKPLPCMGQNSGQPQGWKYIEKRKIYDKYIQITRNKEFGVFVRLKGNITGLIHRTQLSTKLRKGQSITVYVRRIYQDPKGEWKIELVL